MRLNAHPPTVKAWISHNKANAPHHVAKVCEVYSRVVCAGECRNCAKLCKIVQNCAKLYKIVQNCTKLCKRRRSSCCGYNNRRQSPLLRVNARVIENAWQDDLHD